MGGGGGFLGTVLNVISFAVPALRPIAIGFNMINSVANGNPLGIIGGAVGLSGLGDAASGLGSLGDVASSAPEWGSPAWMAAEDFANFGVDGVASLGDSLNYVNSAITNPFDAAMNFGPQDLSAVGQQAPGDFWNSSNTFEDLQSRIGIDAQGTAGDAFNFAKANAISVGDLSAGQDALSSLFPGYDISSLNSQLADWGNNTNLGAAKDFLSDSYNEFQVPFASNTASLSPLSSGVGIGGASTPQLSTEGATALTDVPEGQDFLSNTIDTPDQGSQVGFKADQSGYSSFNQGNGTDYNWQNKGTFGFGNTDGTGWNLGEGFKQPQGLGEKLMGGLKGMTTQGSQPNLWKMGAEGIKGLLDYSQANKARAGLADMYSKAMQSSDPFAGDRSFASQKWQGSFADPETAWNEYIQGQGKDQIENAAAQYAKAGRRNMLPQLMTKARQSFMADYLPKYRASVNPSQFPGGNTSAVNAAFAKPMYDATANKYAPLSYGLNSMFSQPGGNISDGLSSLFNSFGNS